MTKYLIMFIFYEQNMRYFTSETI